MCLNHQLAQFDTDKADSFANRMIGALNEGAMCAMISIGHRTHLFDQLDGQAPITSKELAQRSELNERYVREWLNAMVVAGVIDYTSETRRYSLPEEHAAYLTRRSTEGNFGVFAQYIPMMGTVEDDVVECFKHGGGVPYEKFPRFHEVMAEDSGQTVLSSLEEHILPLIPGLTEKLTKGIRVLDVGCGRGRALNLMAKLFPNSEFTGVDLSEEAISFATAEAQAKGLQNVRFIAKDLSDFQNDKEFSRFDFITTFDAVHDQAKPLNVLKGIFAALKEDGVYLMQDIHASSEVQNNLDHPVGPLLYALSTSHCMTVSLAQDGEGLGTMWGRETATDYLHRAGFSRVSVEQLAHDFQNDYFIVQK